MNKRKQKKGADKFLILLAGLLAALLLVVGIGIFFAGTGKNLPSDDEENAPQVEASGLPTQDAADGAEHAEPGEISQAGENSTVSAERSQAGGESAVSEETVQETGHEEDSAVPSGPLPTEEESLNNEVEEYLAGMTLEEKIYQMFVVTPEQLTGVSAVTAAGDATKSGLEKYPVGGLVYFSQNLVDSDQTKDMLSEVQAMADDVEGIPLFLCVDEEGGRVARVANSPGFHVDTVGPMADVASPEEAYACGDTVGSYLQELRFNVDFAPDADVITNSSNTVIGDRSFGTDADTVTEYAAAYAKGLQDHGILSTFKHFPGHGATEADTHEGYAYTNKSYEELCEAELKPFAAAGERGIDFVMAAHISLPRVTGDDTPCSLSYKMITEILRGDLDYGGLVITDALNMGAISEQYSPASAAVKAVEAGIDLLLMPGDLPSAYAGIYEAVQGGKITEERIDESVRRILRAKMG